MSGYVPIKRAEVSSVTQAAGGGFVLVGAGRAYSAARKSPPWKGPWFTRAIWNTRLQWWELKIVPGFVNGWDPLCDGYSERDETPGKIREMELWDGPRLPVRSMRSIDGTGRESIPPFFALRGVRPPAERVNVDTESVVIDGTPEDESLPPRRYLAAADVWLSVARPTYRMETTVTGNVVTGQLVDYTVRFDTGVLDSRGSRARLVVGPEFPERRKPDLLSRLGGLYEDESEDRLHLSTIYWLSPPLVAGPVDSAWRAYIRRRCGWNLLHAAKNEPPLNTPQVGVDSGLVAFLGRYTIAPQATQGALEAEQQRILAAVFNDTSNEGKFWTI